MCTRDAQTSVDHRITLVPPPGVLPYGITFQICTLGTDTDVNPRLTMLSPDHSLWNYGITLYMFTLDRQAVVLCCPLVSPYCIRLEMSTMDSQTVVDPRYTLLSPGLSLWYNLGDVILDTQLL